MISTYLVSSRMRPTKVNIVITLTAHIKRLLGFG